MSNDSRELNKKVTELRSRFLSKLSSTLELLDTLLDSLAKNTSDYECSQYLERILSILHKIAGTSGTFGLSNLSSLVRSLEQQTIALSNQDALLNNENIDTIRHQLEQIKLEAAGSSNQQITMKPWWESHHLNNNPHENISAKTIVIVDDNQELVNLLSIQLEHAGFDIIPLSDPQQLQATLLAISPAAVVMDVMFPGDVNAGFNTIRDLRKTGLLHSPVLFFSVRDDIIARLNAIRVGCDGYFLKPVDLSLFMLTLSRLTHRVTQEPYRVVVIDDDPEEADYNALILNNAGITATAITNPLQAIDTIREQSPDVILMDINMPECNGFELAKIIRQYEQYLHTPIVFLTTSEMDDDWLSAIVAGGDDFLSKSIRPKELVTSIIARATRARQLSTMITNLSISEARFRSVCESAKDAIVSSDKQGRIVTWNRGAENLFGYTETEIQGSPFTQLFSDNYRESLQNFGQLNEVVALKKDKRECPVDISQSNWTVGKHQFFTRIIRDVSSRKKYEQSLREAKITADNANRAKSEFLSAMSHELRTPLNAIMGFSQVLTLNAEQPLSEYQTECIDYIIKGGQHLLLLIDDILDLAKIESGKIDISLENIQINTLIKECIPLVQPLADKHNIHIQQTTTSDIPLMVKADNTRLKQVLLNLLSNAVKYNHDGGSVTISYELRSAALLRINVADTGIGIPEGKAHELFQPFCRLGAEATNVEGTGIGLSVSKRLVETMAGAIGFENSSQGGSIFWVELPLADTRKENNQTQTATTKNQTAFPDMTGTLLYVEDNPSNLSLIEMIVTHIEGLVLISACNAELGIELARSQQPNLIMLDINLPGMNGFEALAKLRDTEETAHIPVIALSAAATTREIEKGMSAGFHNYITKPLQVNDVITTIQALL